MIIKSMSRKEPSFGQLINYMADIQKTDEQFNVYGNLYARKLDGIEQEFKENSAFVRKQKNGNYLYHEVLSITKSHGLEAKQQKTILREIAYEYVMHRASKNMVFGCLHDDHEDHLHYHLLISANEIGHSKKTRLSKARFDQIKKQMESRVLTHYPELEQKMVINKASSDESEKLSKKGAEQKRRTGKTPQRDLLKKKLRELFENSDSKEAFFTGMSKENLEIYVRGKTIGVRDVVNNRKHRLKTLGLMDEFGLLSERIKLDEQASKPIQRKEKPIQEDPIQETRKKSEEKDQKEDSIDTQQAKRKSEIDQARQEQSKDDSHSQNNKQ